MTYFVNQSLHSKIRLNQRGIRNIDLDVIYSFSDREKALGNGKISLSISKKRLQKMVTEGEMCPQQADRVRGQVIIWGEVMIMPWPRWSPHSSLRQNIPQILLSGAKKCLKTQKSHP